MKRLILLSVIILLLTSCKNESEKLISLKHTLAMLNQIQTASYNSTFYGCYPGDTLPIGEKDLRYFKEYTFPSDTSVGAIFVKFNLKDTSKMLYAYDGSIIAKLDWEKYHYEIDDFSKNRWPYRVVMPPFFARAKAIIEYSLSTNDSISIDTIDYGSSFAYKISIFNERIEFVGRLPIHVSQLGSNEGVISEYILWINKETRLPFKFQRTIPNSVMVESINNLVINKLTLDDFGISNYIPQNMPKKDKSAKSPENNLINTVAQNWNLLDLENKSHSLNDVSSKVYMLNFTSMFCGPCKLSIPFLNELSQKYSKDNFDFVSLYKDSEKKHLPNYLNQNKVKYNILISNNEIFKTYQVQLFPTFFILDKEKRIRKIIQGYNKGEIEIEIEKTIKELL